MIPRTHSRIARRLATAAPRAPKAEGSIADVFASLRGAAPELPARFTELKRSLWNDNLPESWRGVLRDLERAADDVVLCGPERIPRLAYSDIERGLSTAQKTAIREAGVVVVTDAVPEEEALAWKQSIRDYIAANSSRIKGFPASDPQVYELYNTPAQIRARTHPAIVATQRALLSLWHAPPAAPVDLATPIAYFDRLRLRRAGDVSFALGPHVDAGSVERWEDPGYRVCYAAVLAGGDAWRNHDAFAAAPRLAARQDLYHAPNQCSIFRPWQGWTSLSHTGPNEGTLRVLPLLRLATTYMLLRPFFRLRAGAEHGDLRPEAWEPDLDSPAFPGAGPGTAQELRNATHPHLRLAQTMVPVPHVKPGDQVYWHCDTVHAVEAVHGGKGDASVLYIPAAPLTLDNACYLRDQRATFLSGAPAPDFPGGEGEAHFAGRGRPEDAATPEARRMLGLAPFEGEGVAQAANAVLGLA